MGNINLHNYEAFLIDYLDGNLNEDAVAELKAFVLSNPQLELDLDDMDLPSFTREELTIDFKSDLKKTEVFIEDEVLINYLENNLNEADKKNFETKLLSNKELALKLQAYNKTVLSPEALVFANKFTLYKTEEELILNNTALAYIEGQLSFKDKTRFENELKVDVALQKELASFQKTKLVADTSIVFTDKEALKKETRVVALFNFRTVASIAAAVLLIFTLAFVFNYFNSQPVTENKELAKTEVKKDSKTIENKNVNIADSNRKFNNAVPVNETFIAKNATVIVKDNTNKKEKEIELNEIITNSVAVSQENKNIEQEINKDPNESKTIAYNNKVIVDSTINSKLVANSEPPKHNKQNYLIATGVDDEEVFIADATPAKKGFWQRAIQLAKQANKLGVKAIDGEEIANKSYALSFNAFSVEKK